MVSKATISKQVSTKTKVSERQVVEANAIAITDIRLAVFRPVRQDQGEIRCHGYASHGYREGYAENQVAICWLPLRLPAIGVVWPGRIRPPGLALADSARRYGLNYQTPL